MQQVEFKIKALRRQEPPPSQESFKFFTQKIPGFLDADPDHHHDLISSSLDQVNLIISEKSVQDFLHNLADKQSNRLRI